MNRTLSTRNNFNCVYVMSFLAGKRLPPKEGLARVLSEACHRIVFLEKQFKDLKQGLGNLSADIGERSK